MPTPEWPPELPLTLKEVRETLLAQHPGNYLWGLMVDCILVDALTEKVQTLNARTLPHEEG
jgi:hypothetical protein